VRRASTFGCLGVECPPPCAFILVLRRSCNLPSSVSNPTPASINLSKATNLRHAGFRAELPTAMWVVAALQTIAPQRRDLSRSRSTRTPLTASRSPRPIPKSDEQLDLHHLLALSWESRLTRSKIWYTALAMGKKRMCECMGFYYDERREIGLVEHCLVR